jgi:hypothetical protein
VNTHQNVALKPLIHVEHGPFHASCLWCGESDADYRILIGEGIHFACERCLVLNLLDAFDR